MYRDELSFASFKAHIKLREKEILRLYLSDRVDKWILKVYGVSDHDNYRA